MAVVGYHGKKKATPIQHGMYMQEFIYIFSNVPRILVHIRVCPQYPMSGFCPQTMCNGMYIRQLLSK